MSLSEQSQQWYPSSVQVTVLQARNLTAKGKNGTNDAFAIIQLAKDKFCTAVAEKSVSPVWQEEASFDLPLFQRGNAERCTLHVILMHRALGGLDKMLGQAIINLLDLHENTARKKTDWYKLVDKSGKADKDRGEVLLDIQFMRNNMTASMFDLSMPDKPRSRISKLKDKVRGKKKAGLSDSSSAIVPASVNQVLTESEEEEEGEDEPGLAKTKKNSKFKSLFGSKTNLHKGMSQSMSTLGTLPEKNSSLSGSRSSGLNVEPAEGKNKFKFLGHKRNGSTDSKVSLGPFALLNRSKQTTPEQSMCINGNHVYAEDQDPKANSSSTQGSVEDLRKNHQRNVSTSSADSFGFGIPSYKPEPVDRSFQSPQHPQEKSGGRMQEVLDEQEKKRQQEQEARERRMQEEKERRRQEEEEQQRKKREEEAKRAEEVKRQEESRVSERLTNLFGLGKKKEEPSPPAVENPKPLNAPAFGNPFEDIPLNTDSNNPFLENPVETKEVRAPFNPTALPRTAKVSAVKPRLTLDSKSETDTSPFVFPVPPETQTAKLFANPPPEPFPIGSPAESDMFSMIHSSMAPPKPQRTFTDMTNQIEVDFAGSMSEKKRRAPKPPGNPGSPSKDEVHSPNSAQTKQPPLPLPDYDSLFPKKRHGVMTNTRWEHIIAEVSQRQRDGQVYHSKEESVDGPNETMSSKSVSRKEQPPKNFTQQQRSPQEALNAMKKTEPKKTLLTLRSVEPKRQLEVISEQIYTKETMYDEEGSHSAAKKVMSERTLSQPPATFSGQTSEPSIEKPTPAARSLIKSPSIDDAPQLPKAKTRQKTPVKEPVIPANPQTTTSASTESQVERKNKGFNETKNLLADVDLLDGGPKTVKAFAKTGSVIKESVPAASVPEKKVIEDDPFPNDKLISQDPWAFPEESIEQVNLFTDGPNKAAKPNGKGLSSDDFDSIFGSPALKPENDPFFNPKDERNLFSDSFVPKPKPDQIQRSTQSLTEFLPKKRPAPQPLKKVESSVSGKKSDARSIPQINQEAEDFEINVTSLAGKNRKETPVPSKDLSTLNFQEPFSLTMPELHSGAKSTLFARVLPSEAQGSTLQSAGGGGVLSTRRPHPVKPMNPNDGSILIAKDFKSPTIREVAERGKNIDSGPYMQLTHEELVTLVVKQQTELSKKDEKIVELEEYIDNLIVRVIEEKPSILLSVSSKC